MSSSVGKPFPFFVTANFDQANSRAFPEIKAQAREAFASMSRDAEQFSASTKGVSEVMRKALDNMARGMEIKLPVLDLNAQASQLTARAAAAQKIAEAMNIAAKSQDGFSLSARNAAAQAQMVAQKEEAAAAAARDLAQSMATVQAAMEKAAGPSSRLAMATEKSTLAMQKSSQSSGLYQAGLYSLGQQLQDISTQASLGTKATTIFAMQAGQTASAISMMAAGADNANGKLAAFSRFLAGPWGVGLGVGAAALGLLATKFAEVDESAKAAEDASRDFAKGLLDVGKYADNTTGKLLRLAGATRRAMGAEHESELARKADKALELQNSGFQTAMTYSREQGSEVRGGTGGNDRYRQFRSDPDVRAAIIKAGGPKGNLFILEREIAAAAKRRPELQDLAKKLSAIGAEGIAAGQEIRKLRENLDFVTGKRDTLPGFTPAKDGKSGGAAGPSPSSRPGSSSADDATERLRREQEKLDNATAALISRFDQAAGAAIDLSRDIDEIFKARDEGRISPEAARQYERQAEETYYARLREHDEKIRRQLADDLSGQLNLGPVMDQVADDFSRAAKDAERIRQSLYDGANVISTALGPTLTQALYRAAEMNGDESASARLLRGASEGYAAFGDDLAQTLNRTLERVFGERFAGNLGKSLGRAMAGAGMGMTASSMLLGSGGNRTTAALGGALGEAVGSKLAGGALGKALGSMSSALGPLGSILGGLAGGLMGGLFKKTNSGSAVLSGSGAGNLSATGTNSGRTAQASKLGNSVQDAIDQLAEQFGASVGSYSVSIGTYKDNYRVSTTGSSKMGGYKGSAAQNEARYGLYDFGDDQSAAIAYAVLDAIRDGALEGLRSGTQRLLQASSDDINQNLSKALKFEQVFKDLKRWQDPVGAAVDEVNSKFRGLIKIFEEAGASAQEYADLEKLYGKERAEAIKQAGEAATASLKALISDLTTGDSGLSLTTRLANARATYDPLEARAQAGDTTAYDDYAQAARTLLDIQRQIYGSGTEYFDLLGRITSISGSAVGLTEAMNAASSSAPSPFDTTPIVSATETQTQQLVAALQPALQSVAQSNADLVALIRAGSSTGGGNILLNGRYQNY